MATTSAMGPTSKMSAHSHLASPKRTFTSLPTEIHLLIASNLTYPDALSLKHTNQYFYSLVYTGVNLKIEWLIERRRLHLDCPHDKGCELGSDMRFCRGSVRLLMKRRREHGECESRPDGRGCLVFGTKICTYKKEELGWIAVFKKFSWGVIRRVGMFLWWVSLALLGAGVAWFWMEHQRRREILSAGGSGSSFGS
ncbi:hypothetical protein HYFRA_00002356 [Hymenoscyphus fraxineus]|uniref:F-box domain-containing protein n=1 Tax=Hymenoscyphus fraxineus TaxID=746836 RepID=A0A9N9L832_9HELO|nr:hypothetical protein HYFRA_00002356 [Hymenoscyphus fraxineus]